MDISIELFLVVLTMAVFGLTFLTAFFSPIARKIGFRNIRRRIGNTALVVLGSMVGSALITGSLVLGDSLDRSFLNIVEENLGEIDVWVGAEDLQTNQGAFTTFTNTELEQATTLLEENARQDGVLPILNQVVTARKLNAQGETVLNAFIITMVAGDQLQLADFGESPQVFPNLDREEGAIVSSSFAKRLELAEGDTIAVTLGQEDVSFYVEHIYEDQGIIGVDTFFVNADYIARQLQLAPDLSPYNSIYVSHPGGLEPEGYDGDQYREDIIAALEGFESERIGLNVNEIKQSALDGFGFGTFITLFLVLSIFGIIAGILLIANLYSMLAEERKFEMGVLRAIALNRFQLTRSFVYEGLVYSLASSLLGVIVGVGLGIALTVGVNEMFSGVLSTFDLEEAFEIEFAVEANSLLIGFTVGALITFLTATFSSYLISKLNIVSAIRNIPEEAQRKLNFAWVVKSALILLLLISTLSLLATSFFVEDMLEGNLDDYSEVRAGEIVDLAQGYTFYLGVVFSLLVGAWLVARVSRMLSTKDLP
ncbi:MAG: ABC transporter permease, partial [Candidatus Dojkabacteria bacterium]